MGVMRPPVILERRGFVYNYFSINRIPVKDRSRAGKEKYKLNNNNLFKLNFSLNSIIFIPLSYACLSRGGLCVLCMNGHI